VLDIGGGSVREAEERVSPVAIGREPFTERGPLFSHIVRLWR